MYILLIKVNCKFNLENSGDHETAVQRPICCSVNAAGIKRNFYDNCRTSRALIG